MRRSLSHFSLAAQLIFLVALALVVIAGGIFAVVDCAMSRAGGALAGADSLRWKLIWMLSVLAVLTIGGVMLALRGLLLSPLRELRLSMGAVIGGDLSAPAKPSLPSREWRELDQTFNAMIGELRAAHGAHEEARRVLAQRTHTVDSLLEFSQTIQGAGLPEQIFTTLARFLEQELKLAGVAILAHQADMAPAIGLRAALPLTLIREDRPVADLDAAKCPCMRQNLPRQFRHDGATVRCAIDQCLSLGEEHGAYCIPFNIGRQQVVVHMLLGAGEVWDEARCQLARTYVNSAASTLISLHLLAEAEKQSMTDPLTGLYNRRSMEQLLQREVALSERHGHPLSVVMIDMDHFKEINDTHGHAAGDHLLRSFADVVRMTLRKTDLPFRYGGDEFVIALPQTPLTRAEQVVGKLRQAFAAMDFSEAVAGLRKSPTLSIGLAQRVPKSSILTLDQLIAAADQALYQAKLADRDCVRVYTPPKAA